MGRAHSAENGARVFDGEHCGQATLAVGGHELHGVPVPLEHMASLNRHIEHRDGVRNPMGKTMLYRTMRGGVFVSALLLISSGTGADSFNPVRILTQPLTMTGIAEPAPTSQADPTFRSVHVKTAPLTMTGIAP